MELELRYFKCHDKYKVSFSKGIILVKGPSGKGKSSIFEAITWVLYGTTREIDPWTNNTAKTRVTLKYNGMKIVRSKRPNRLLLTTSEGTYEDAIAQDIIESTFSSKSIWECTGYIDEDAKNTFPFMTPKERLNTLMTLIYPSDNPEVEIEKIKRSIENSKKEYESSEAVYNSHKKDYDKFWKKNSGDIMSIQEQGIPQYTAEELKLSLDKCNKEIITLRELETRYRISRVRLLRIEEELTDIESLLIQETNISELEEELRVALTREELENSKYLLPSVDVDKFIEEDYDNTLEIEKNYDKYMKMLKKYDVSDYVTYVEDLRDKISNCNTDFYPLLKRKEGLKSKISMERYPPEIVYTWDEVMKAKEYESSERHNRNILRDIAKYKISLVPYIR